MSKATMTNNTGRSSIAEKKTKVHSGTFKSTVEGLIDVKTTIGMVVHTGDTKYRLAFDPNVNPQAISEVLVMCHSQAIGGESTKERMGHWVSLTNAQTVTARKEIEYDALEENLRKLAKERAHAREEQAVSKKFNDSQNEEGSDSPPAKKGRYWG
jgi:hypothetical protein